MTDFFACFNGGGNHCKRDAESGYMHHSWANVRQHWKFIEADGGYILKIESVDLAPYGASMIGHYLGTSNTYPRDKRDENSTRLHVHKDINKCCIWRLTYGA